MRKTGVTTIALLVLHIGELMSNKMVDNSFVKLSY